MSPSHLVVDGSNIATEGRSTPSLQQLDDAIRQYQAEFPDTEVIVVVDATFGHRIDAVERAMFDEAVAHGELVSPPAGAIGRGDAFVLRVAERVGAQVLSNDSFQEFHAEHPWLFDEGRLMGGKPIPGVGWIFTPRLPVRGPRSRAVTSTGSGRRGRARSNEDPQPKSARSRGTSKVAAEAIALATAESTSPRPVKVAKEPAKAAKKTTAAAKAATVKGSKATKATKETAKATKAAKETKETKETKAAKVTKAPEAAKATKAPEAAKATKAAKEPARATKATKDGTKATKETAKTTRATKASKVEKTTKGVAGAAKTTKAGAGGKSAPRGATKATPTPEGDMPEGGSARSALSRRGRRGRGSATAVQAAIEAATEEALDPSGEPVSPRPSGPSRGRRPGSGESAEPVAVNDPLTFLTFVTEHPLGSSVLGTVSSYVSHGAMVDVDGMSCYLPLTGLGDPPPRRAREVVERGAERSFVVVALDPPRRGAELALPELARTAAIEPAEPARPVKGNSRRTKKAGPTAS